MNTAIFQYDKDIFSCSLRTQPNGVDFLLTEDKSGPDLTCRKIEKNAEGVVTKTIRASSLKNNAPVEDQDSEAKPVQSDQEIFNAVYEEEPITEWSTYKSSAFGVTFSYPPSLTVKETKDEIRVLDSSQEKNTDLYSPIVIKKEQGIESALAGKYIGFKFVRWNPYPESSRKFVSDAGVIHSFTGDPSVYAMYLFPNGFAEERRGTLIIANTVSLSDSDPLLKKAQERGALNLDFYQDLPSRILSTLHFINATK